MSGFIQIIEFRTRAGTSSRHWRRSSRTAATQAGASGSSPTKIHVVGDRDDPGRFLNIVEFESYEAAMENSNAPRPASSPPACRPCATARRPSTTST